MLNWLGGRYFVVVTRNFFWQACLSIIGECAECAAMPHRKGGAMAAHRDTVGTHLDHHLHDLPWTKFVKSNCSRF